MPDLNAKSALRQIDRMQVQLPAACKHVHCNMPLFISQRHDTGHNGGIFQAAVMERGTTLLTNLLP